MRRRPDLPQARPGKATARPVDTHDRWPRAFGYAEELWPHRLLAAHIRATAVASGHPAAAHVVASTVVKLLHAQDLQPHRVPYDLERRDPDFDPKRVRVLHVDDQVELALDPVDHRPTVRLSDDEKPGMPALGRTAPDRPSQPGVPGPTPGNRTMNMSARGHGAYWRAWISPRGRCWVWSARAIGAPSSSSSYRCWTRTTRRS